MSTRANIIIKDDYDELTFYRHSDGYPEGVASTLNEFVQLVRDDKIRDNVGQAAGWLILLGSEEYKTSLKALRANKKSRYGWKVGAYEPTKGLNADIEYLYEIDLSKKTLRGWHHDGETKGEEVTGELEQALLE